MLSGGLDVTIRLQDPLLARIQELPGHEGGDQLIVRAALENAFSSSR